ncbi:MAG: NAD(P)/FAD-dependent oxidoreductase [Candidatus Bathyarchaeota archaeon]|nr:NAD(P)/FAD-dependent oxidoreductase [Candidatus Bathyarchaeota archaeon]
MVTLRCDIAVVGAGPSGSMAARAAAERGSDVILLEEHPQVGLPVFCGEGLSLNGLRDAGIEPSPEVASQRITMVRVFAPGGGHLDFISTNWTGYVINRDVFDRLLSERAVEAGAELMVSTKATEVLKEGGVVSGVRARRGDQPLEIEAKVVIGADGYASTVRRTAGLGRWHPDIVTCAQFRLGNLGLEEPEMNEFHLGSKVAPGAYAWVFPKSEEVANVGIGVRWRHTEPPIAYLKRFVGSDPRFEGAEVMMVSGGIIPVSGVVDKVVGDGVMIVGDAAGQLIPCTGAGVHAGVVAGRIAGEVAASAIDEGNVSALRLSEYERRFDVVWGKRIRDSRRVVEMLDRFSDDDLNTFAEVLTGEDVLALANGLEVPRVLTGVIKRAPLKIIRLVAAYIRG